MSYSFSVRAANRSEVMEKIGAELDKVVAAQPMHSNDRDRAFAAAQSFLEMLPEAPEGREISVSLHGSVGWTQGADGANAITGAGVGVSASLV